MMGYSDVIDTRYRHIAPPIPSPESEGVVAALREVEPRSMSGFLSLAWERAEGFQVWDAAGNMWLDFSSGVILTNAGHANARIAQAIREQLDSNLFFAYCNPHRGRLQAIEALRRVLPAYLDKVFLLTTGSEAVEAAIKLARLHGQSLAADKYTILSYHGAFHGRTMAAQAAGGFLEQQAWMGEKPGGFAHMPYPDCARCPWGREGYDSCGEECLERSLAQVRQETGVTDAQIAAVLTETFPGPTCAFMPSDYVQALRRWASAHEALLIFDEVQAGFGRTGKWFGFEHYGVEADLITLGKGMTSSLPMSAVAGRAHIMDLPSPGEMSSTHTGNPICAAAAVANIEAIHAEGLVENAAAMGSVVRRELLLLRQDFPGYVGGIHGHGLAQAFYLVDPDTGGLNPDLARRVIERCFALGLLLLPTGGRSTVKIAPPLCITEGAIEEGFAVIAQALRESRAALGS
jgi:4-aminobutyrate aminotransferase / (S)-3-amino-2-methylpropionate transaminase / 5-aminovalerate transaminase